MRIIPTAKSKSFDNSAQIKLANDFAAAGDKARDALNWKEAEDAYKAALNHGADARTYNVQLGHALKEQGRLEEAEHCYSYAIELDASISDSHLQMGHVLKLRGLISRAIAAYKIACDLDSRNIDALREYLSLTNEQNFQSIIPNQEIQNDLNDLAVAIRKSNAASYGIFQSISLREA